MTDTHIHWHKHERKYADLDPSLIPTTESLQDTIDRYIRTCSLDAVCCGGHSTVQYVCVLFLHVCTADLRESTYALSPYTWELRVESCCCLITQTATATHSLEYLVKYCALHCIVCDVVSCNLISHPRQVQCLNLLSSFLLSSPPLSIRFTLPLVSNFLPLHCSNNCLLSFISSTSTTHLVVSAKELSSFLSV